jgi:ZIP family zinc transporter
MELSVDDYLLVLAISLLPAGGNIAGGFLAENVRTPPWVIGAALHAAVGVAIAVVSVDLMPRIIDATPVWLIATTFFCGAAFSFLLAYGLRAWMGAKRNQSGAWMVYMAVAADLLSDGFMVGVGTAVTRGLGLLLGLSQVVANIPGGFAAIGNFRNRQVSRNKRLLVLCSFVVPSIVGVSIGYLLLRGAAENIEHAALGFIVGVLLLATVEDMVPEADEPGTARWISTLSFTAGFVFFVFLSAAIG